MALSDSELKAACSPLARRLFRDKTANLSLADLKAAVAAIDARLDEALSAGDVGLTPAQVLNQALPAPASSATAAEKALILAFTVSAKYGV